MPFHLAVWYPFPFLWTLTCSVDYFLFELLPLCKVESVCNVGILHSHGHFSSAKTVSGGHFFLAGIAIPTGWSPSLPLLSLRYENLFCRRSDLFFHLCWWTFWPLLVRTTVYILSTSCKSWLPWLQDVDVSISENKDHLATFKSLTTACLVRFGSNCQLPVCFTFYLALQKLVGEPLVKERFDMETLDSLGLITSKNAFNQKYVKTKTKLLWVLRVTLCTYSSLFILL